MYQPITIIHSSDLSLPKPSFPQVKHPQPFSKMLSIFPSSDTCNPAPIDT